MEAYQVLITACAGIITVLTLFEKIGLTARLKKREDEFTELQKMLSTIPNIHGSQKALMLLQEGQNNALLSILRNELFQSFRINRELNAWTDEECFVQTKLHQAYKNLHGNGEEEIWWEKKKSWRIVSNFEYSQLVEQNKLNKKIV